MYNFRRSNRYDRPFLFTDLKAREEKQFVFNVCEVDDDAMLI